MTAAKKTASKRPAAKKAAASGPDPLEAVREDTPNVETTDLDRNEACRFCGRDAVARIASNGRPVCETHQARAQAVEQTTEKL